MIAAGDSGPGAPDAPDPAGVSLPPLWECAHCGRAFANRNQSHACGRYDLGPLFARSDPVVRETFDAVVRAARRHGPLTVVPEKTRVALQVRMSFAAFTPRQHWLDGHVVLARAVPHPRFRTIQTISPRNHVHVFRLRTPTDVDAEVETWLAEAYDVGAQRHLGSGTAPGAAPQQPS